MQVALLNRVLEDLGLAPVQRGRARFVLGDVDRGPLRTIHACEGDEPAARTDHRDVHPPVALLRLGDDCGDRRLGAIQRNRRAGRNIERHFLRNDVERILRGLLLREARPGDEYAAERGDG